MIIIIITILAFGLGIYLMKKYDDFDALFGVGMMTSLLSALTFLVIILILIGNHTCNDVDIEKYNIQQTGIEIQLDRNKENKLSKYERVQLIKDIVEYNTEIKEYQMYYDSFWVGIFIPKFYKDMKLYNIGELK